MFTEQIKNKYVTVIVLSSSTHSKQNKNHKRITKLDISTELGTEKSPHNQRQDPP